MLKNNKYSLKIRIRDVHSWVEFDPTNGILTYKRIFKHFYKFLEILFYRLFHYHGSFYYEGEEIVDEVSMLILMNIDKKGKKRKLHILANKNDYGLLDFLYLLKHLYPAADLSYLGQKEARSFLRVPHFQIFQGILAILFIFLIFLGIFLASLWTVPFSSSNDILVFGAIFAFLFLISLFHTILILKNIKKSAYEKKSGKQFINRSCKCNHIDYTFGNCNIFGNHFQQ